MGNDPPDKCATCADVHMTAIGDNELLINFEPGCNADATRGKCSLCIKALEFDKDFIYPHCMLCNTCSLVNVNLEERSSRTICGELDCGVSTLRDVNVNVQSLGKFILYCHDWLTKKMQAKEPLVGPTTTCTDTTILY